MELTRKSHLVRRRWGGVALALAFALLLAFGLGSAGVNRAQAAETTVTIGDGANSQYNVPYCTYYKNGGVETLYLASEVGEAGSIKSIAYDVISGSGTNQATSLKIYLGVTTATSIASTASPLAPDDGWTLVFEGSPNLGAVSSGWETMSFNTPFAYDGTKNLLVLVVRQSSSDTKVNYNSTSASNLVVYKQSDSDSATYASDVAFMAASSLSSSNYRPNVQFTIDVAAGPEFTEQPEGYAFKAGVDTPTALTAKATSEGDVTAYQWYRSTDGAIADADALVVAAAAVEPTAWAIGASAAPDAAVEGVYTFTYTPEASDLAAAGSVYYYCLATNAEGSSITEPAAVQVYTSEAQVPTNLTITSDPAATENAITTAEGDAVTLTADAQAAETGDTLYYQWYAKGADDADFVAIENATAATYTLKAGNGTTQYMYKARASHEVPGNLSAWADSSVVSVAGQVKTISTPEQLADFAAQVNGTSPYAEADNFQGRTVLLAADIDLSGIANWTPIGMDTSERSATGKAFKGTFDGQGHAISGLTVSMTSGYGPAGLFCMVQDATLKNFTVASGTVANNSYGTGAVVGQVMGTTLIENVGVDAGVTVSTSGNSTGGIVGRVYSSGSTLQMTGCYNKGTVASTSNYAGGLLGAGLSNNQNAVVESCYNLGSVSGTNNVGGIVGRYATVKNCVSAGAPLTFTGTPHGPMGGLEPLVENASPNYWLESVDSSYEPTLANEDAYVKVTAEQLAGTATIGEDNKTLVELLNAAHADTWMAGSLKAPAQDSPILAWEYTPGIPTITGQPASDEYEYDAVQAALTVTASLPISPLEGNDGTLSYQWYKNTTGTTDCAEADKVDSAVKATYQPAVAPGSIEYFYCAVTNTYGADKAVTAVSNAAKIQVHSNTPIVTPTVTLTTGAVQTVETGATVTITASAAETTGEGVGTLTYQWFQAESAEVGAEDTEITAGVTTDADAKTSSLVVNANAVATNYYYCKVTNTFEGTKTAVANSPVATVTAQAATIASAQDWTDKIVTPMASGNTLEGCVFDLTADISVDAVAGSSSTRFKGTLNGNGHAIELGISTTSGNTALFAAVDGASISDLVLTGSVAGSGDNVAALAAYTYGTTAIARVGNNAAVTNNGSSSNYTGGLVGRGDTSSTTISGCYNKGAVTTAYQCVGGILGGGSANINSCYNTGAITSNRASGYYSAYGYSGGIAGNLSSYAPITNSVNTGSVATTNISSDTYGNAAIYASSASGVVSSESTADYWLDTSAKKASGYSYGNTYIISKTADEMKGLASTLNVASAANGADTWYDGEKLTGQASPILWWEYPHGKPVVTMKTEDARVAAGTEQAVEVEADIEAAYTGTVSYAWYANADGDTSAREADKVSAAPNAATYAFTVAGADATYYYCVVKNVLPDSATTYETTSDAVCIQAYDKEPAVPVVAVTPESQDEVSQLSQGALLSAGVTYGAEDQGAEGEVAYQWQELVDGNWVNIASATEATYTPVAKNVGDNKFRCVVANTYGGATAEGTSNEANVPGKAKEIGTTAQLVDFAASVNGTDPYTQASDYAGATVVLAADIDLSDIANWTPIGTSANRFKGTFDGQGHAVTLAINATDVSDQGLFGYVSGATVKDLVVRGSVSVAKDSGYPNRAAGVAAYSYAGSTFTRVGNEANVNVAGNYAGGIVGQVNGTATFTGCYNKGSIASTGYAGGIVGGATANSTLTSCYNVGAVSGDNNSGGIVGRNGKLCNCVAAGTVTCAGAYKGPLGYSVTTDSADANYYLATAYTYDFDATDAIVSITAEQLAGTATIGTDEPKMLVELLNATHADTWVAGSVLELDPAQACPALAWEAGPVGPASYTATFNVTAKDGGAAIADAAITVKLGEETVDAEADGTYKLEEGMEYAYTVEKTGYVTAEGTVKLTQDSTVAVELERYIDPADQAKVDAVAQVIWDKLGAYRPSYYAGDFNFNTFLADYVKDNENYDAGMVFTVMATDEPAVIALDGTITYNKSVIPTMARMYSTNVSLTVQVELNGAMAQKDVRATVGWDQGFYKDKMQAEADAFSATSMLGENESLDAVTSDLALLGRGASTVNASYALIAWESSDTDVVKIEQDGVTENFTGTVTRPDNEDKQVTLTATFSANDSNLNTNVESAQQFGTITKQFTVTVKGIPRKVWTAEEMLDLLDTYYVPRIADKLDSAKTVGNGGIVLADGIDGDLSLPQYTRIRDTSNEDLLDRNYNVFDNKEITVTSTNPAITVNGYAAPVDVFQENGEGNLVITFTRGSVTVTRELPVKVNTISAEALAAEIAALEAVKAVYWDGINDSTYADANSVTGNLHSFQEANVDAEGNVTFAYSVNDATDAGIKADGYWETGQSEQMEAAGWNRFRSSNNAVVQHENLVVLQPEDSAQVTITSWLSSARYGKFAPAHPDNADLQKLYKQEVSADVVVLGTKIVAARAAVEALPAAANVVEADRSAVVAARQAVNDLSDLDQSLFGNDLLEKLAADEAALGIADSSELAAAVKAAQSALDDSTVTDDGSTVDPSQKYATKAQAKTLQDAIAAAQAVLDNLATATQTQLDSAAATLKAATQAFQDGMQAGTKGQGSNEPEPAPAAKTGLSKATVAAIPDQTYTSYAIEPAVTVKVSGKTLAAGTDYTVSYADNVEVGTATATVTGMGSYAGTCKATFKIVHLDLALGFTDLDPAGWYLGEGGSFKGTDTNFLDYTLARGLMRGKNETSFDPLGNLTRAEAAVVIYRLANGADAENGADANTTGLPDVADGEWYTRAVNWCVESGVVTGYKDVNGKAYAFGPYDNVTREQLATMIARYCIEEAGVPSAGADVSSFPDGASISLWAREGAAFCAAHGIITGNGTDGTFAPRDNAQRCAMAKIIAVADRMLQDNGASMSAASVPQVDLSLRA